MKKYLAKVIERQDLSRGEMTEAFDLIMSGEATPSQIAGLIVALRMKGETVDEMAGGAAAMRQHAVFVDPGGVPVVDTCGTGGDSCDTFNISTTAALVVAGADVPVAKHGNRAISSKCGSADLLATLGVKLDVPPEVEEEAIREAGIGFLFAPGLHPAMKYAMPSRKEMGVRTIFNMLGPLTNPAGAKCQIIGVFASELTESFAHVLRLLGSKRAFIVHGHDGMDEMTTTTTTRVSELVDGQVKTYDFDPIEVLEDYPAPEDLAGGDAEANAAITRGILAGKAGAPRDIVCLNAGATIVVGGKAANLREGFTKAQESIDSGSALKALEMLVEVTNR